MEFAKDYLIKLKNWWTNLPLHIRITSILTSVLASGLSLCSVIVYYFVHSTLEKRMMVNIEHQNSPVDDMMNFLGIPPMERPSEASSDSMIMKIGDGFAKHAKGELESTLLMYLIITTIIISVAGAIIAYFVSKRELGRIKEGYQKLEQFAGDASHELRTPLAVIKGQAELYSMRRSAGTLSDSVNLQNADAALGKISAAADQMGDLVNDLLELTRTEEGGVKMESVDLQELLDKVLSDLPEFSKGRQILVVNPALQIKTNPSLLYRILVNLCTNIQKYTPAGTPVEITARVSAGATEIVIADHGEGVSHADLPRIYERFWTSELSRNSEISGTGLGLAIVKQGVDSLGGLIFASQTPGGGLTHTLRFG